MVFNPFQLDWVPLRHEVESFSAANSRNANIPMNRYGEDKKVEQAVGGLLWSSEAKGRRTGKERGEEPS